jgi:hypothetical protein
MAVFISVEDLGGAAPPVLSRGLLSEVGGTLAGKAVVAIVRIVMGG